MSSSDRSFCCTDWGDDREGEEPLLPELTLRGCGLRNLSLIVRGAQGAVYLAEDADGNRFAVKRLFTQRSDFGIRGVGEGALREATVLALVAKETMNVTPDPAFSIIRLHGIVEAAYKELCLILEYCPLDLSRIIIRQKHHSWVSPLVAKEQQARCPVVANMGVVRYLMRGLLQILSGLHEKYRVIHRDLKLSNLLVGEDGSIRLSDFGSARLLREAVEVMQASECTCSENNNEKEVDHGGSFTHCCGGYTPVPQRTTLIYQPPECLLGDCNYGTAVDVWAAGVVFAEILLQRHLFRSMSEITLISDIWRLLGTPSTDEKGSGALSSSGVMFAVRNEPTIDIKFGETIVSPDGLDLLKKMLQVDPEKRITAAAALCHPFFSSSEAQLSMEGAPAIWREKVKECLQEGTKVVPMGVPLLGADDDGAEDEDNSVDMCTL